MITAKEIKERLDMQPFRPFTLHLSSGRNVRVEHPECVMLFKHKVVVGHPSREEGIMDRDEHCSMLHIAAINEVASEAKK